MNRFFERSHLKNLLLIFLIGIIALLALDGVFNDRENLITLIKEIVIVATAAFLVSAYFEYYLRKEISNEFIKIIEMKEEFGKSGIEKYISNFKDIELRAYFKNDIKKVDIYLNFGSTVFNLISDSISNYCKKKDVELNIYMLSPENKFIIGLGELWGKTNPIYSEQGIKTKINNTISMLSTTFEELKAKNELNAKIRIYLLKRNPVFYSFYRFDDEMIYVPLKHVENKDLIPLSLIVKKTINTDGIYNKSMQELEMIKNDTSLLDIAYKNL